MTSRSSARHQADLSSLGDSSSYTSAERAACLEVVRGLFGLKNRNGRVISPQFEELPDPQQNASYYQNIPDPRSMRMVIDRLHRGDYLTPRDFYVDLKLCFSNFGYIASRSSRDWQDAVKLDQTMDERWDAAVKDGALPDVDAMFPDDGGDQHSPSTQPAHLTGEGSASPPPASQPPEVPPPFVEPPPPQPTMLPPGTPLGAPGQRVTTPVTRPPGPTPSASAARVPTAASESPAPPSTAQKRDRSERGASHSSDVEASGGANGRPSKKARRPSTSDTPAAPAVVDAAEDPSAGAASDKPRVSDKSSGWLEVPADGLAMEAVLYDILAALREGSNAAASSTGAVGVPLLSRLPEVQRLPDRTTNPQYYAQVQDGVSLEMVEMRLRNHAYTSSSDFDKDLYAVFRSAHVYYRNDPARLGATFTLQRLYQELTKGDGRNVKNVSTPSATPSAALASVSSGPGTNATASSKVKQSEQIQMQELKYKEHLFKVGDFVHLMNPDDATKPIIGQIFRLWQAPDTGDKNVHVCWYNRPEQTVHITTRRFLENEVFRAYSFVDHAVEDVLERCLVMFHTRFLRGRPKPPYWTSTMPTYICEHRYKEDSKSFKKIKNWTSCIPVELRDQDEDANFTFYPTPLLSSSLKRVPSPFLRGEKGPGGVGDNETMDKEQWKYHATDAREIKSLPSRDHADPTPAPSVQQSQQQQPVQSQQTPSTSAAPAPSQPAQVTRLPKATTSVAELAARQETFDELPDALRKRFRRDPKTGDVLWFASPPVDVSPADPVHNSLEYLYFIAQRDGKEGLELAQASPGRPRVRVPAPPKRNAFQDLNEMLQHRA